MSVAATRYRPRLAGLLAEAARAYRARDDDTFRALLSEAAELAPERFDVAACLAGHHIQAGSPERALAIYENLFRLAPDDADNLFRLAHWRRFSGETEEAEALRLRLFETRPDRAAGLSRVWDRLDAWFARPVGDAVPAPAGFARRPAIVALGYQLAPDGTPRPELIARLERTLEAARRYPESPIVVSGGVPRSGRVEAVAMREWLEAAGIASGRIWEEGYSRDVVENLIYSRNIVALNGGDAVLIVTSAGNVRRAGAALEIMAGCRGRGLAVQAVASSLAGFADDGSDRLKAYRDALRAFGMPMMSAYPELSER